MFVLSLGGSIVVPDAPDAEIIRAYRAIFEEHIRKTREKLVVVIGGGAAARTYQKAFRDAGGDGADTVAQDWIGIMATRLNAELIRRILAPMCVDPVVRDPTAEISFEGSILVAAGWKPGFSTDNDAVLLAERFGANTVVNLSNIAHVYTADPKTDPDARPLERVGWSGFRAIVGNEWIPGKNLPFDPVAARRAAESGLRVIVADGKDLENTRNILRDAPFYGTTIGVDG